MGLYTEQFPNILTLKDPEPFRELEFFNLGSLGVEPAGQNISDWSNTDFRLCSFIDKMGVQTVRIAVLLLIHHESPSVRA